MKKQFKVLFKKEYIMTSFDKLDIALIGIYSDGSTEVIIKKLKIIEKELKNTWIKGYKKGLIDKSNL